MATSIYGDSAVLGPQNYYNQAQYTARDAAYNQADTQAASEAADYEAAANQASAAQSNSLAQQLATARNSPGGGIRRGIGRRKGLNANNAAATGLNAANAAGKLARRKAELRASADNNLTQQNLASQQAASDAMRARSAQALEPIFLGSF